MLELHHIVEKFYLLLRVAAALLRKAVGGRRDHDDDNDEYCYYRGRMDDVFGAALVGKRGRSGWQPRVD